MRSVASIVFLVISWLLVAGLFVQVFLAGLGVFDDPARFASHRDLGYTLGLLALAMLIVGLVARVGRRLVALSAVVFLLFILQSVLVQVRADAPMVAALHPVNGFVILLLSIVIGRGAWLARRGPAPSAA